MGSVGHSPLPAHPDARGGKDDSAYDGDSAHAHGDPAKLGAAGLAASGLGPPASRSEHADFTSALGSVADNSILGSRRPKPKKMWQRRYVKLLVVGDSGLGKTTLVRCLLAVPGESMVLHDGSSTSFAEFQRAPADFCSVVEWDDEDDHVHWVYQIQDTPGYGDDLDLNANIERVRRHIEDQNTAFHLRESDPRRAASGAGPPAAGADPRVDVAIFCLQPHRVRNIDLLFMYEVSQLVPIIPVVTKADTMTIKEALSYRNELARRLAHPCLPGRRGAIRLFTFSDDALDACGLHDDVVAAATVMRPPFLVVCSNAYNPERLRAPEPELWPERNYMWGTSEAMNPAHSDLLLLRRLLLVEGVEEISRSKVERYEVWRQRQLCRVKPLRKLGGWLLTTAIVIAAGVSGAAAIGRIDLRDVRLRVTGTVQQTAEEARDAAASAATTVKEKVPEVAGKAADAAASGARAAGGAVTDAGGAVADKIGELAPKKPPPKKKGFFGFGGN